MGCGISSGSLSPLSLRVHPEALHFEVLCPLPEPWVKKQCPRLWASMQNSLGCKVYVGEGCGGDVGEMWFLYYFYGYIGSQRCYLLRRSIMKSIWCKDSKDEIFAFNEVQKQTVGCPHTV